MAKTNLINSAALTSIATYVEFAVILATGVVIARHLQPVGYGVYAYSVWICGLLILFQNHALTTTGIKFVAEARGSGNDDVARAVQSYLLRLQILSSAVVLTVFGAWAMLFAPTEWKESLYYFLGFAMLASFAKALSLFAISIAKGWENYAAANLASVLGSLISLGLVLATLVLGHSVLIYFGLFAAANCMGALLIWWMSIRQQGERQVRQAPSPELKARISRHLWQTSFATALGILSTRLFEMTLLKRYTGTEAVAYFAIASTLAKGMLDVMASGVSSVLLPAMSRHFGKGGVAGMSGIFNDALRYYYFVSGLTAGIAILGSEAIVKILYGAKYESAVMPTIGMLLLFALTLSNGAFTAMQSASDRQNDRILSGVAAVAASALLSVLLIPKFGLVGAILSVGGSSAAQLITNGITLRKHAALRTEIRPAVLFLGVFAIALAIGYSLRLIFDNVYWFVFVTVVFVVLFSLLTIRFRCWRESELQLLEGSFNHFKLAPMARAVNALARRYGRRD